MTNSSNDGPPSYGSPPPRYASFPEFERSLGPEFIEIAELAGLHPDPWQKFVVYNAMGITADGKLATPRVGVCVSRQNGKGGILEIITLGRLFVLGSPLTLHSAHLYATSQDAFKRLVRLIKDTPELDELVKYSYTNGSEGIRLHSGPELNYIARSKGGGRGRSADCLFLDEAMYLPDAVMSALIPTGSAKEFRQVWYTGSAVDQQTMPDGRVFAQVREKGIAGDDPGLAYFEWSADVDTPDDFTAEMAADPAIRAATQPAYRIRITDDAIDFDVGSLLLRGAAVERFNVGDWPILDGSDSVIDLKKWASLVDKHSKIVQKTLFAFDVSPSRSQATISVAGIREDGLRHVETVDTGSGTAWITPRLKDLQEKHRPLAILCDAVSPAASLRGELEEAGVEITLVNTDEHAQACGALFDAVRDGTLRHGGTSEMTSAIRGAVKRDLGDRWAWSRKNSSVDITPLVASTLAHWAISKHVEGEIIVVFA